MVVAVGTDLVGLDRFAATLRRTPSLRARLFTPAEAALDDAALAARFAAKEALAKALGAPDGLAWHDAEVVGDPVRLVLRGTVAARAAALGASRARLTLSCAGGVAVAVVLLDP